MEDEHLDFTACTAAQAAGCFNSSKACNFTWIETAAAYIDYYACTKQNGSSVQQPLPYVC